MSEVPYDVKTLVIRKVFHMTNVLTASKVLHSKAYRISMLIENSFLKIP